MKKSKLWRYYPFTQVYHKWESCDVWFLRYGEQQTECFVILDHFLHFYSPTLSLHSEKMEKAPGNIIIIHLCTTNNDHAMYCSWNMESDRPNILSFLTIFCHFTFLTTRKIKFLEKWKKKTKTKTKTLEILSFYECVP